MRHIVHLSTKIVEFLIAFGDCHLEVDFFDSFNIHVFGARGENSRHLVNCHTLPNFSPTFVICFGKSSFVQHVVADVDKNSEFLLSCESIGTLTLLHHVEHLALTVDHRKVPQNECGRSRYHHPANQSSQYQ